MRGSAVYQVQVVFQAVNEIGTSKHAAKAEAREQGAKTWHQIGKAMGIKSYATADAYRDVWVAALKYAKSEFGVKDIERLSASEVRGFLASKVEEGVAHATMAQYAAALEKLEVALNRYAAEQGTGREYAFHGAISEVKAQANLERFEGSRAYADPDRLVAAVRGDAFQLAAAIQRESGARISEVNHIDEKHLRGWGGQDVDTGQEKGVVEVQGKGGKVRELLVSWETYVRLERIVREQGRFEFDKDAYRRELQAAALKTGQVYQGSHGLRWSWAQERHQVLQQGGWSYEQVLGEISREMGHERADITEHYLI